jgi:hypothetical protein
MVLVLPAGIGDGWLERTNGGHTMSNTTQLTTDQTDAIINEASTSADGAIEDAEVTETTVTYYFESGSVGTVNRTTGQVSIQR